MSDPCMKLLTSRQTAAAQANDCADPVREPQLMKTNSTTYSFALAAKATAIPARTLRRWLARGIVSSSNENTSSARNRRRFDLDDIIEIALVRRLRRASLTLPRAA